MSSLIVISQSGSRPIYLQIMEQIRQKVAVGEWKPGESIPSIRALAVELQVSVITVKRAYLELEREGIIVTQHGKGSIGRATPTSDRAFVNRNFRSTCATQRESECCLGSLKTKSQRDCAPPQSSWKRRRHDRLRRRIFWSYKAIQTLHA